MKALQPKHRVSRRQLLKSTGVAGGLGLLLPLSDALFPSTSAEAMGAAQTTDTTALSATRFAITVSGLVVGVFDELIGILSEASQVDFSGLYLGSPTAINHDLTGAPSKLPSFTVARAAKVTSRMWEWHLAALADPQTAMRDGGLVLYDLQGTVSARYHFVSGLPARWINHSYQAGTDLILREVVTLAAESLTRIS